jgi:hypothetical protein
MFLIFINDITDEIVGLGRLFADDTSIGHIAQDESTLRNMINTDLNHLKKWSNRWARIPSGQVEVITLGDLRSPL